MTINARGIGILMRLTSLGWHMKPCPKFTYEQLVNMEKDEWQTIGFFYSQDEFFQFIYDGFYFPKGLWIPPDWINDFKKWNYKEEIIAEIGDDTWNEDLMYCGDESNWKVTLQ